MEEPWKDSNIIVHSVVLANNFREWFGKELTEEKDPEKISYALYHAPFVLVSHSDSSDPVFNYANKTAQQLWKMDWEKFTSTPSRLSAEPEMNPERAKALNQARIKGLVEGYEGVRISSEGERFRISDAYLFNVMDAGRRIGQAATFSKWEYL